jgi:hypothetical protein
MHYLIDGHNLIAQMPDIDLEDPNDEILLVLRLRSWVAGSRKRRATVIFDGGLPGGRSRFLSTQQLNVIFASEGRTADALLVRRIKKAKNPAEFTLVSSDLEVIDAARARRMKHVGSEAFARRLGKRQETESPATPDEADEPAVSQEEIAEWLALFDKAPKVQPEAAQSKPRRKEPEEKPETSSRRRKKPLISDGVDPALLKRGEDKLSGDEVDEWLKLFGRGE